MTIKLKPDCELKRAIDNFDYAAREYDLSDKTYDLLEEARAHLLEVIQKITAKGFWGGYTVGRDSRRIFTEQEAVGWADKFMGVVSDG